MTNDDRLDGNASPNSDADYAKVWVNTTEDNDYEPIDVSNIKEEWGNLTVYLPEQLREELELAFRETSYECMQETNHDIQKLRDFYPLIVMLGIESIDGIDGEEIPDILAYCATEYGFE